MMGCALRQEQCCVDRICPVGYRCCVSPLGTTCCPQDTICRGSDVFVPTTFAIENATEARLSTFVNVSDTQLCLPITSEVGSPTDPLVPVGPYYEFPPYIIETTFSGIQTVPGIDQFYYRVVDIMPSQNVTACGRQMCNLGDECIYRYRNLTRPFIAQNTSDPICLGRKLMDQSAWDDGCYFYKPEHVEESYPVGCCPADTTPCGAHQYTFNQYEVNAHDSPVLYDTMTACVYANETCCFPQVCPPATQCCTARRQIYGNITALKELYENVTFISDNEGQTMCCPDDAYCCEFIPLNASPEIGRFTPQSMTFCGLDDTCRFSYYGNRRRKLPEDRVSLTTPITVNFFTGDYDWRVSKGIVGNMSPMQGDTPDNNICVYNVKDTSTGQNQHYDITCEVLNKGEAPSSIDAGLKFAKFVGPGVQYQAELELGGPITCPSPTPQIWCVPPV